jgi:hypothetical protein
MNTDFVKGGEFLEQLSEYQLLIKDSDPWNYLVNGEIFYQDIRIVLVTCIHRSIIPT